MTARKKLLWPMTALLLTILVPTCALCAPDVLKALFWKVGGDPAVAVLQGEYWGQTVQMILLGAAPFVPLAVFAAERVVLHRARRRRENAQPPEFASEEERRAFYRQELKAERQAVGGTPWIIYSALCGFGVFLFALFVIGMRLPQKVEAMGRDLEMYRANEPAVYEGPMLLVERQLRNGARAVPDERFVYYDVTGDSFRCAATLLAQTQLMQSSYTVTYLPETGTILTITDAAGNVRTNGAEEELPVPEGCWLYGDLAVPICDQVEGYEALSKEQQALFDLLYSQVFSGDVAAGKLPTRSFDLPYSLKKKEFNAVLELYEASVEPGQYPNHGYRTDDGRIVRRAYCYGIIHSK